MGSSNSVMLDDTGSGRDSSFKLDTIPSQYHVAQEMHGACLSNAHALLCMFVGAKMTGGNPRAGILRGCRGVGHPHLVDQTDGEVQGQRRELEDGAADVVAGQGSFMQPPELQHAGGVLQRERRLLHSQQGDEGVQPHGDGCHQR